MKSQGELLKGTMAMLVLHLLRDEPMYGYQMVKEAEGRSGGAIAFKEGTLYPTLHGLEAEGMIEGFWQTAPNGRRRRYYRIAPRGREALAEKKGQWLAFSAALDRVLGEARA